MEASERTPVAHRRGRVRFADDIYSKIVYDDELRNAITRIGEFLATLIASRSSQPADGRTGEMRYFRFIGSTQRGLRHLPERRADHRRGRMRRLALRHGAGFVRQATGSHSLAERLGHAHRIVGAGDGSV